MSNIYILTSTLYDQFYMKQDDNKDEAHPNSSIQNFCSFSKSPDKKQEISPLIHSNASFFIIQKLLYLYITFHSSIKSYILTSVTKGNMFFLQHFAKWSMTERNNFACSYRLDLPLWQWWPSVVIWSAVEDHTSTPNKWCIYYITIFSLCVQ